MSDTKKEWKNKSVWEKTLQITVNIGVILIALVVTAFAYWIKQDCSGIDKEFLYCYTHPQTVGDIIGLILFWFGCFWLSGIWGYFVADDDEDPWKTVTKIAWGCAVAGPAISMIF